MAKALDKTTSEQEWKKILMPEEFRILRGKGTLSGATGAVTRQGVWCYFCAGVG